MMFVSEKIKKLQIMQYELKSAFKSYQDSQEKCDVLTREIDTNRSKMICTFGEEHSAVFQKISELNKEYYFNSYMKDLNSVELYKKLGECHKECHDWQEKNADQIKYIQKNDEQNVGKSYFEKEYEAYNNFIVAVNDIIN